MPLNAGICTRFALCINQLSAHNNATIRAAMKTIGLFDVRDEIVLRLLRADLCSSDISAYLSSFPFEHVANQSKFRDQQGLLLVLRLFHRSAADRTLQRMVGVLLVDVLFAIELNRKMVARLLGDDEVMQRFSAATSCSTTHGAEHSSKMDAFLDWYYAPTPDVRLKRNAIEQRIESLAIPVVGMS